MMMPYETEILKGETADLLAIFQETQNIVRQAAQQGEPIHKTEEAIWTQLLKMGRGLISQLLKLLGTGDQGETVELPDGRTVKRLPELHARRYVSIFGEFKLLRTAYGTREGQKIEFVPLDNRLQLPESPFSYLLQDWDQGLCVEEAFAQASHTIARMLGLEQSVDSLERMNAQMAKKVEDFRYERPKPIAAEEGEIFVNGADGKGVVMRREAGEAAPPSHRTKGEKASRKAMAIVGAVYSVDRYVRTPEEVVAALFGELDPESKRDRPKPCQKQTIANMSFADVPGKLSGIGATYTWIFEETMKRNRTGEKEMVHICDGQEALWDARDEYLPARNTTDVLDILHVTPRLWEAAHLFHGEASAQVEPFVRERVLKMLQGKADLVIRGLRVMGTKHNLTGNKKKSLATICNYLEKNLARMRYDEYLAKGYPIASGVIEGACRHLVKDRMERAGMHWTRDGAQAMLDVRSIHTNGDWEAYQTYRIERETKRLYPWRELVNGTNYYQAI